MKFRLYIDMDNSAFGYDPFDELVTTLETNIKPKAVAAMLENKEPISLRDSNGNSVGYMAIYDDAEDTYND